MTQSNNDQPNANVAEANIQRLLTEAYRPEAPEPAFVQRMTEAMAKTAVEMAAADAARARTRRAPWGWRVFAPLAAAATILIALGLGFLLGRGDGESYVRPMPLDPSGSQTRKPLDSMQTVVLVSNTEAVGLAPATRPAAPQAESLAVGQSLRTGAGERRRAALPDGSVIYLNEKTTVSLDASRQVSLPAGEIYLEVSPRQLALSAEATFVVKTPTRQVSALGTRFGVKAGQGGTSVVVTQGKVKVSGLKDVLTAGQELKPDAQKGDTVFQAPRASHELGWMWDLVEAADSPLVPKSDFEGGALVAVDPFGQDVRLSLRKYNVDVYVQDGFARTTIDQTFFNHENRRMEGTFYFPLPPDASLSRLAMYVDGRLMEGGMAERDYARHVYESIVYTQRDPALLEWVDGSTFKMRVFPLEARQEKRIIISYTQKLPEAFAQLDYRFPGGHSMGIINAWWFNARIKDGAQMGWASDLAGITATADGSDLVLGATAKNIKPDRDVVFHLYDLQRQSSADVARFSSSSQDGFKYMMLRYQPNLPANPVRQRRDWVFLFESSGNRDPLLARTQIEVIKGMLQNAERDDTFAIVTAGTHAQSLMPKAQPATPENVAAAVASLEKTHLIGALDLGRALESVAPLVKSSANPYIVHLGTAQPTLGERRIDLLVKQIPAGAHYIGVAVGKNFSRQFMKDAASRSGGYTTQINPDEPVAWRAFELVSILNSPRLMDIKVADDQGHAYVLWNDSLSAGEEIAAVTQYSGTEPRELTLSAMLNGESYKQVLPVGKASANADYLPRTWAKLEIDRLLAEDASKNKEKITALSKAMYVMSPYTSLLVLENEAMYAQYKVDRGRKDHWAMYAAPEKIDVVTEPLPGIAGVLRPGDQAAPRPPAEQVMDTILVRMPVPPVRWPSRSNYWSGQAVTALQLLAQTYAAQDAEYRLGDLGLIKGLSDNMEGVWFRDAIDHRFRGGQGGGGFGGSSWQRSAGEVGMARFALQNTLTTTERLAPAGAVAAPAPRVMPVEAGQQRQSASNLRRWSALSGDFDVKGDLSLAASKPQSLRYALSKDARVGWESESLSSRFFRTGADSLDIGRKKELREAFGYITDPYMSAWGSVNLQYQRPYYNGDWRAFGDLLQYAPGMNTSAADILSIIQDEAADDPAAAPGTIDPAARKLIDEARAIGWRSARVDSGRPASSFTITFDGTGRYAYERVVSENLHEQVVCDGKTLVHLYGELGIGAQRTVSRFHRQELADLVPAFLPPAEDLARGNNINLINDHTVAITPVGAEKALDAKGEPAKWQARHLLFEGGRLAERRVVEMPTAKTVYRQLISEAGVVRVLDADGKELDKTDLALKPGSAPSLVVDTKDLVILPMPLRTREQVIQSRKLTDNAIASWSESDALAVIGADLSQNNWDAQRVVGQRFFNRGDRRIGFYVLLMLTGQGWSNDQDVDLGNGVRVRFDPVADHPRSPLAQFIADQLKINRQGTNAEVAAGDATAQSFVGRLQWFRSASLRWTSGRANQGSDVQRQREREAMVTFANTCRDPVFALAALGMMSNYGGDTATYAKMADIAARLADQPALSYVARYEQARLTHNAGQYDAARKLFTRLYTETIDRGILPPIDYDFRNITMNNGGNPDVWSGLIRDGAAKLMAKSGRPAGVYLAWQCYQIGDQPLAEEVLALALADMKDDERFATTLTAIRFLSSTGQYARGDALLQPFLDQEKYAAYPELWRIAAMLANGRGMIARALSCEEKALDLEYKDLPKLVNLQAVRSDYGQLLGQYQQLASAIQTLQTEPPRDVVARVIRYADRWRSLDPDGTAACQQAARILQSFGMSDMAWDYLTTPLAEKSNEAAPWANLAQELRQQGDVTLSDRAYATAFDLEPTNAQVLWDRAMLLQQNQRFGEAKQLLRKLADGTWEPRFNRLQTQAKGYLGAN